MGRTILSENENSHPMNCPKPRLLLQLFIAALSFYLFTSGGHLYGRDGVRLFLMSRGFFQTGSFSVPQLLNTGGGKRGLDGKYYTPFGVGQPLAALPLYAIGHFLTERTSYKYSAALFSSFFNAFTTAITLVFLVMIGCQLGYSRRNAVVFAWIYGLSTMAWPYSKYFYSEPLTLLCLLGAFWAILRSRSPSSNNSPAWLFLSGCFLAWGVITRPITVVMFPLFAVYLFLVVNENKDRFLSFAKALIFFSVPVFMAGLWVAGYNYLRFGSPFDLGYAPLPGKNTPPSFDYPLFKGLYVFIFSPGKSLFLFSPVLLLSLVLLSRWWKEHRKEAIFSVLMALHFLLLYSMWCQLEGGYSWGPRFLLPAVPFLMFPLFSFVAHWRSQHRVLKLAAVLLVSLGVVIQFLGVTVNFTEIIETSHGEYYRPQDGRYNPSFSPIPQHFKKCIRYFTGEESSLLQSALTINQRKNLLVINLNWAGHPDFWWEHLIGDGVSLWLVLGVVLLLVGSALYFGIRTLSPS